MKLFPKSYKSQSDESLMQLLLNKEQKAFEELYARYSRKLLNYFYNNLAFETAKAQDFLHDLFLKIIEKPEYFDSSKSFKSWIYTLATNMIKNEYKKQQVRSDYFDQEKVKQEIYLHTFDLDMDLKHFATELQSELNQLDADCNLLFSLRYHEELSIPEIAQILQIPEGTVKSRLFYLVKKLSNKLILYKPN